jgi:hypothetical protein
VSDEREVVRFGVLHPDGTLTDESAVAVAEIRRCPWLIIAPEHYRLDGSCRCDDSEHWEMEGWGYAWDAATRRWEAP